MKQYQDGVICEPVWYGMIYWDEPKKHIQMIGNIKRIYLQSKNQGIICWQVKALADSGSTKRTLVKVPWLLV